MQIPHFGKTCELLKIGDKCELFIGYMAVYRTAFTLSGFFFLMSLLTVGIKKSRGFRADFHNGAWFWKFLILIGIGVGVFLIPSERIVHFQIGRVVSFNKSNFHLTREKIEFGSFLSMDVHCLSGSCSVRSHPTMATRLLRA